MLPELRLAERSQRPDTASPTEEALLDEAAQVVASLAGLRLPSGSRGVLREVVFARALECFGGDLRAYITSLGADSDESGEAAEVFDRVSVGQTEFFRGGVLFDVLHDRILPEVAACTDRLDGKSKIRLWSAACSTGEEAWSLAAVAESALGARPGARPGARSVETLATDWSRPALEFAAAGQYPGRARADVPDRFAAGFAFSGDRFGPRRSLRRNVGFARQNLLDRDGVQPCAFDLILLCNVLIYFDPGVVEQVVATMSRALRPGGILCLGRAESLWTVAHDLEMVDYGHVFVYRKPRVTMPVRLLDESPRVPAAAPAPAPAREAIAAVQGMVNAGNLSEAQISTSALLSDQPQIAEAHYLMGSILERLADPEGAYGAYRRALYLDPGFVLAHLCAGGIFERAGDAGRAAVAYRAAADAFTCTDPLRFEMFLESMSVESLGTLVSAKAGGN